MKPYIPYMHMCLNLKVKTNLNTVRSGSFLL